VGEGQMTDKQFKITFRYRRKGHWPWPHGGVSGRLSGGRGTDDRQTVLDHLQVQTQRSVPLTSWRSFWTIVWWARDRWQTNSSRSPSGTAKVIAPDLMEEFLDDCLVDKGQMIDKQFKITFRYRRKVQWHPSPLVRQNCIHFPWRRFRGFN
jgi:hypothetical protein